MIRFNPKIRIKRYKNDGMSFFLCFYITLMILAEMFETAIPVQFRYVDEIFAVFALIYIAVYLLFGGSLKKLESGIMGCTLLMVLCGLLGNIIHNIHSSVESALMDVFLFIKIYVSLLFGLLTIKGERVSTIYHYLLSISKCFLCILVFGAILDTFQNGISAIFSFYYKYYGSLAWWAILLFSVVYSDKKCNRLLYFLCTVVLVLKNRSGLGMLSLGIVAVVYLFVEKSKKIKWYHFILMLAIGILIGHQEIKSYLMNTKAPRYLLIYYGIVTANRFFPLGSGFATYASAQAAQQYSRLYYEYGFDRVWGMTESAKQFIQDSYYPVIIGQLGYFGVAIFIVLIYTIMKKIVLATKDRYCRCSSLIAIITWMAAGIGFLGSSTTWGCCMLMLVVLLNRAGNYQSAN